MPDSVSEVSARRISVVGYDHPDAVRLVDAVMREYVARYGGVDATPVDPAEFAPPSGLFLVGYEDGTTVAIGGWRRLAEHHVVSEVGPVAEIKRMYVVEAARGRGHARAILARLEDTARDAGYAFIALETGYAQPEAIALYRSSGYYDVPAFGHYASAPGAVHLGKPLH